MSSPLAPTPSKAAKDLAETLELEARKIELLDRLSSPQPENPPFHVWDSLKDLPSNIEAGCYSLLQTAIDMESLGQRHQYLSTYHMEAQLFASVFKDWSTKADMKDTFFPAPQPMRLVYEMTHRVGKLAYTIGMFLSPISSLSFFLASLLLAYLVSILAWFKLTSSNLLQKAAQT